MEAHIWGEQHIFDIEVNYFYFRNSPAHAKIVKMFGLSFFVFILMTIFQIFSEPESPCAHMFGAMATMAASVGCAFLMYFFLTRHEQHSKDRLAGSALAIMMQCVNRHELLKKKLEKKCSDSPDREAFATMRTLYNMLENARLVMAVSKPELVCIFVHIFTDFDYIEAGIYNNNNTSYRDLPNLHSVHKLFLGELPSTELRGQTGMELPDFSDFDELSRWYVATSKTFERAKNKALPRIDELAAERAQKQLNRSQIL